MIWCAVCQRAPMPGELGWCSLDLAMISLDPSAPAEPLLKARDYLCPRDARTTRLTMQRNKLEGGAVHVS